LRKVRELGCQSGIALSTPIEVLHYIYEVIDMVLIMSINPGFGGQKFLSLAYPKIEDTRRLLDKLAPTARIQVDGGITQSNPSSCGWAQAMTKQIDARLAAPSWCWTCNEHAITWTNESGAVWHV
jgi:ribulose-phosphate 3-epimerase